MRFAATMHGWCHSALRHGAPIVTHDALLGNIKALHALI